jgi:GT2 family glycosyltransferase
MNPVLMLTRNALELTKAAVRSVLEQDIPAELYVIDNDSTDGTPQFLREAGIKQWRRTEKNAVSAAWNFGLEYFFTVADCEHVLVVNNDIVLRPDTYRELLEDDGVFVTGVGVNRVEQLVGPLEKKRRPHPDFSCFLIRKACWDRVGRFDESMELYASDCDYHLRMHKRGIAAYTIGIPFFHEASGTLKYAADDDRRTIEERANLDRERFRQKWGFSVGSPEYAGVFD